MAEAIFVTDLHGHTDRYRKLFDCIQQQPPSALFIGGDIFPSGLAMTLGNAQYSDFLGDFLIPEFRSLQAALGKNYPQVFLILGNDDGRGEEPSLIEIEREGLWLYIHNRKVQFVDFDIYGYACVPPTPFQLKDWEKYDVSRFVDPGCVSPEEGFRTIPVPNAEIRYGSIQEDLAELAGDNDLSRAIFLFHTPPYQTKLDRAALDGKMIDYVPLDVHVGSIAVKRFIEERQPYLSLHGHIHESTSLTGEFSEKIGRTTAVNGAHDGRELSLIRLTLGESVQVRRELL